MRWISKEGYEIDTDRLITDLRVLETEFPHLQMTETVSRLVSAIAGAEVLLIETGDMEKDDATITDDNQAGGDNPYGSIR